MKQIIQDLKSAAIILEEVLAPAIQAGYLLIKTHNTLVSLGTACMLVDFGKANYIPPSSFTIIRAIGIQNRINYPS